MKKAKRTFPTKVTVYVKPEDEPTWKRAKKLSARSSVHNLSSLVSAGLALILDRLESNPESKLLSSVQMQTELGQLRDDVKAIRSVFEPKHILDRLQCLRHCEGDWDKPGPDHRQDCRLHVDARIT